MKISPLGAELFHVDGRIERHDEANNRFLQICVRAEEREMHLCI